MLTACPSYVMGRDIHSPYGFSIGRLYSASIYNDALNRPDSIETQIVEFDAEAASVAQPSAP